VTSGRPCHTGGLRFVLVNMRPSDTTDTPSERNDTPTSRRRLARGEVVYRTAAGGTLIVTAPTDRAGRARRLSLPWPRRRAA
jgi:hypothetical protein